MTASDDSRVADCASNPAASIRPVSGAGVCVADIARRLRPAQLVAVAAVRRDDDRVTLENPSRLGPRELLAQASRPDDRIRGRRIPSAVPSVGVRVDGDVHRQDLHDRGQQVELKHDSS